MATFALVHGAWHGAWCWDRLVPELAAHGHASIAVELPCDDPAAGCAAYAEAVLEQTAAAADDLVLVGHSLAGLTIPLVATARPARKLVFLCSLLPRPGLSLVDQLAEEPGIFQPGFGTGLVRDDLERSYWSDEDAAIETLFPDCPRQLAAWAAARLRHQGRAPTTETCPLEQWPAVESVFLFASDDAAINPDWSRGPASERLGVRAVELPGGHSPFLSRPAELAEALVSLSL